MQYIATNGFSDIKLISLFELLIIKGNVLAKVI
jgi:hypothetical protein